MTDLHAAILRSIALIQREKRENMKEPCIVLLKNDMLYGKVSCLGSFPEFEKALVDLVRDGKIHRGATNAGDYVKLLEYKEIESEL